MSQSSVTQQNSISESVESKKIQVMAAALLGLSIFIAVGFAPLEVIHNATHDSRHSTGFPCH